MHKNPKIDLATIKQVLEIADFFKRVYSPKVAVASESCTDTQDDIHKKYAELNHNVIILENIKREMKAEIGELKAENSRLMAENALLKSTPQYRPGTTRGFGDWHPPFPLTCDSTPGPSGNIMGNDFANNANCSSAGKDGE